MSLSGILRLPGAVYTAQAGLCESDPDAHLFYGLQLRDMRPRVFNDRHTMTASCTRLLCLVQFHVVPFPPPDGDGVVAMGLCRLCVRWHRVVFGFGILMQADDMSGCVM